MASENPRAPRHEVATLSEHRELQRSSPGRSSSLTCVFRRQTRPTRGEIGGRTRMAVHNFARSGPLSPDRENGRNRSEVKEGDASHLVCSAST